MGITALRSQLNSPWKELYGRMLLGQTNVIPPVAFPMELLEKVQERACITAAKEIYQQLPVKSYRGKLGSWRDALKWALRTHNMAFVQDIDMTTRRAMIEEIEKVNGWKPKEAAEQVLARGLNISRARAMRIAVTESTRALNIGIILAANDFPFEMRKHWIHSHDERVRWKPLSHRFDSTEGKKLGEPWFNGEYILFPGDPRCTARNTVNCRCFLGVIPIFDSEGNLIPKR